MVRVWSIPRLAPRRFHDLAGQEGALADEWGPSTTIGRLTRGDRRRGAWATISLADLARPAASHRVEARRQPSSFGAEPRRPCSRISSNPIRPGHRPGDGSPPLSTDTVDLDK
ncbi:hypothetical protein FRAHR75_1170001 [Frankia sp. Hr75.2]|nr:hypothetical protein FRAHR75_1170001 [Frankia sp. Hr75.2]